MTRKKRTETLTPLVPSEDYWTEFLKSMGFTTEYLALTAKSTAVADEEIQNALKDPLFEKYLRFGPGKTGGPATVSEFLQLTLDQQKWYVNLFKTWKKIVKRDKIDKILMRM